MKKFIFSLGKIDKKLIWPSLFSIIQVALNINSYYYPSEKLHQVMDSYSISFGQMLGLAVPYIFRYQEKIIKKGEICIKKNIKYQAILWFISLLLYGSAFLSSSSNNSVKTYHSTILSTREAIVIIFLTIATMIFLKYKYHIHHIISLVIFCLVCIAIDFLLDNYEKGLINQGAKKIILDCVNMIIEIINYCYQSYMMNSLYYHYWSIDFSLGLFLLIGNSISLITFVCFFGDPYGERNFINNIFYFFREVEPGYIILRFIIMLILQGFLYSLFRLLVLEKLTPNHMLISYEISKLSNVLIMSESEYKWYSIILFAFQIFILMFFLEIFEFNLCNLNLNTKKNIQEREKSSMTMRESVGSINSGVEIEGYVVGNEDNSTHGDIPLVDVRKDEDISSNEEIPLNNKEDK